MSMLKGVGAIIAGLLVAVVLAAGTSAVLEGIGYFPPSTTPQAYTPLMFLVSLVYSTAFTFVGGFVVGKLAPRAPMKHVAVLAVVAAVLGIAGILASWDLLAHGYVIGQAVLAFPAVWFGGKLAIGESVAWSGALERV